MVIAGDAGEQRVASDRFRARFGKQADHDRVVIRSGSSLGQLLEQRKIQIRELEQLDRGGYREEPLKHRQQYGRRHRRQHPTDITAKRVEEQGS